MPHGIQKYHGIAGVDMWRAQGKSHRCRPWMAAGCFALFMQQLVLGTLSASGAAVDSLHRYGEQGHALAFGVSRSWTSDETASGGKEPTDSARSNSGSGSSTGSNVPAPELIYSSHLSSKIGRGQTERPKVSSNTRAVDCIRNKWQIRRFGVSLMSSASGAVGTTAKNNSRVGWNKRLGEGKSSVCTTQSYSVWPEVRRILQRCLRRAGRGGLPGAAAGVLQVITLMWLRTVVNYQCRYGTSMAAAAAELYRQGGILRFYRGVSFALISNPLSRFGMAAANEGAQALCDVLPGPVSVTFTTWVASLFAGIWRVVLTPLDTCKTVLQVEGSKGFALLTKKVLSGNVACLYQGAAAASAATAVGYFPWFLTFNYLNGRLKTAKETSSRLLRNAGIGLAASIMSDLCTNSIRVLKTTKQAAAAYDAEVTYRGAAALVIEADGWAGLFGRGLSTRILANGLQSMLFTVVWRYLHEKHVAPRHLEDTAAATKADVDDARKALSGPRGGALKSGEGRTLQRTREAVCQGVELADSVGGEIRNQLADFRLALPGGERLPNAELHIED